MHDFIMSTVVFEIHKILNSLGLSLDLYFYAIALGLLSVAGLVAYKAFKTKKLKGLSVVLAGMLSVLSFQTYAVTTVAEKDFAQFIIKASETDLEKNKSVKAVVEKYDSIKNKNADQITYSEALSYHYDIRALNEK